MNGDKLGSWVSEQYVGFAKIMLWWLPMVDCAKEEMEDLPSGNQKKWKMRHNKEWLEMRELPTEGKADKVRKRVFDYMTSADGPPPIVRELVGGSETVVNLVKSLYSVVALAMAEDVDLALVSELRFSIKRFMTDFELMDQVLRPNRAKPRWVTTYNVAGLQNIISAMWMIGPLRNYWEGSYRGEAYFKLMKPLITMGLRKNWQQNILKRMLKRRSLAQLLDDDETNLVAMATEDFQEDDDEMGKEEQPPDWNDVANSDYKSYSTCAEVRKIWNTYGSFSAVLLKGNIFKVMFNSRTQWMSINMMEQTVDGVLELSSIAYVPIGLQLDTIEDADLDDVTHGVMFLPHIPSRIRQRLDETKLFCIVRSDWKIWDGSEFLLNKL